MTVSRTRSHEEVAELLTIGLTWIRTSTKARTGWVGNGILQTMRNADALTDTQYKIISGQKLDEKLKAVLMRHAKLVWPDERFGLTETVKSTDKWIVVLVEPKVSAMFFSELIVQPKGYRLLPTAAGEAHAAIAANSFKPELTQDSFLGHWRTHSRQVRRMFGVERDGPKQPGSK